MEFAIDRWHNISGESLTPVLSKSEKEKRISNFVNTGIIYIDAETQEPKLSIEEKKKILLNNIFGVDIDPQAVEVTKLSLFLKMLEDEGRSLSSTGQQSLFRASDLNETILPSMVNNIKCGNSLIGSDYYSNKDLTLFDIKDQRKVNVFDWEKEFSFNGFDCVIGNPPYVSAPNQVAMPYLAEQREWLSKSCKYKSLYQKWDLYIPFIEKGLQLLKDDGLYSAIVPYPLTNQSYAKVLREIIMRDYNLIELVDLNGTKVFPTATVSNCIPVIAKEKPKGTIKISHIDKVQNISVAFEKTNEEFVQDENTAVWNVTQEKRDVNRHADMHVLGDYCYISKGMVLNSDENDKKNKFVKADLINETKDEIHCRMYIEAKDVEKYYVNRIRYLEYGTKRVPQRLSRPTFPELYNRKKILTNKIGVLQCIIDDDNVLCDQTNRICILWKDLIGVENKSIANSVKKYSSMSREEMEKISESIDLRYLLAIMNSKYANVLLDAIRGSGNIDVNPEYIRNIPIPSATPEQQTQLARLVDQMIATKQQLASAKSDADRKMLEQRIQILDSQINTAVYKLYGLTEEEIKVVERQL